MGAILNNQEQTLDLIVPEVSLVTKGPPVKAALNVVYSTAPVSALDEFGNHYFVKGEDDHRIVLAEAISHVFAGLLEIPVPSYAVGRFGGNGPAVFASSVVDNATRDVSLWIQRGKVSNPDMLTRLVALDVWVANNDRNMGNLLGRPSNTDANMIELVAIDFEKAAVVRKTAPLIEIAAMPAKGFWPRGDLGTRCKSFLKWSNADLERISAVSDENIAQVVASCVAAVRCDSAQNDSISHVLKKRRDGISVLVKEVWN